MQEQFFKVPLPQGRDLPPKEKEGGTGEVALHQLPLPQTIKTKYILSRPHPN